MPDNGLYTKVYPNNQNFKFDLLVVAENISPNMNVTNVQWELDLPSDFPIYGITPLRPSGYSENRNFHYTNDFFYPKTPATPNYVSKTNNVRTFYDYPGSERQQQFQTGVLGIYSLKVYQTNALGKRVVGIKNAKAFGPSGEINVIGASTSFYVVTNYDLSVTLSLHVDWNTINDKQVPTLTVMARPPVSYSAYSLQRAITVNDNCEVLAISPLATDIRTGYANFIHTDWAALTNHSGFYRASGTQ